MRCSRMTGFTILGVLLLVAGTAMAGTAPEAPAPVEKVVYAQPFTLEDGFAYPTRKEKPQVKTGYLLIVDADPELVLKMDRGSRILYVGKQTGWRLNPGYPSGRAFVLVPAKLNKRGEVDLDLTRSRIWFGTHRFEGHADKPRIDLEHELAVGAGIGRRPKREIDAALREADGQPLAFRDLHELRRHAAELSQEYLPPEEAKQAEIWLKADRLGEDVLRRVPLTVPER